MSRQNQQLPAITCLPQELKQLLSPYTQQLGTLFYQASMAIAQSRARAGYWLAPKVGVQGLSKVCAPSALFGIVSFISNTTPDF